MDVVIGKIVVVVIIPVFVILVGQERIVKLVPVTDKEHGIHQQKHVLVQQVGREHIVIPVPVTAMGHGIHLRKSVLVQQAGRELIVKSAPVAAMAHGVELLVLATEDGVAPFVRII